MQNGSNNGTAAETLAIYVYPVPYGTSYHSLDLSRYEKVVELFDYCQILEAAISKSGWDFLIAHYGYEQLFSINQESGWFDCSSIEQLICDIGNEREISPDSFDRT